MYEGDCPMCGMVTTRTKAEWHEEPGVGKCEHCNSWIPLDRWLYLATELEKDLMEGKQSEQTTEKDS